MKKKVLSLLLSTAMVASLAACGSTETAPATESKPADTTEATATEKTETTAETATETAAAEDFTLETLNIVVDGTVTATVESGQAEFVAQWEEAVSEKLGHSINININQLDHSDYSGTVSRLLTTGTPGDADYPDALIMSATMLRQYQTTGLLWDMADAYDNADFQARMVLPAINENLKDSEGHLYGFAPTYGNGCVTYLKKASLDAVGIDADSIKTYDDYYNMLLAFHNGDPDGNGVEGDTYGVIAAGFVGNEAPYVNYLPEFWQGSYPAILQDENGTWYDGFQTQETKDALLRLQQAYADGAIDPETLTASTKIAREKYWSNDQTGSAGAFTYWAGSWYQNITDGLVKNEVDSELVELAPIEEITSTVGGYINREAPVWCIIDDGDGDNSREQAIFDAFIETMMDGDTVQTLWTYGAEGVHWSTEAETFTINAGTENEKTYEYQDGEFHLKQSPNDPNTLWKKNHLDPALTICSLQGDYAGYVSTSELASEGNKFFVEHMKDAPASPASATLTEAQGTIDDAKSVVIASVIVDGKDVDEAMNEYVNSVGEYIDAVLAELNSAE